jgi:hypothetical protein
MVARAPRSGSQVARSGERETAYRVVREAIAPANVYYRAELHFMAGWIALRFLSDPAAALVHFAHVDEGSANPIAAGLKVNGFQSVEVKADLTREQMLKALQEFPAQSDSADWSVIYYSGYGLTYNGVNSMIPVNGGRLVI